jgi:dTDP-4-amino-4,6-dideoxygalactose transaminase
MTCVIKVNPIKYLAAKPVYVDIAPANVNKNVGLLEGKITPNTKVIIAEHTYGYPCDMDAIMNIAEKREITVIEDCCLALGSEYRARKLRTFGKAAYFSFQWNKPFATGLGGMVLANDSGPATKIKSLCAEELCEPSRKEVLILAAELAAYRTFIYPRTTALAQTVFRCLTRKGAVVRLSGTDEFEPRMAPDFFKAMSNTQARSGLRQLSRAEEDIAHRREWLALVMTFSKIEAGRCVNTTGPPRIRSWLDTC